uniref:Uncharacterized protein n=1 Tax=Amphiprion percula TaxID=161767 RepID=A0A3P8S9E1_AMPPE
VVKEGLLLCIEVLNRQKVFRADSTRVALPISAVGLVNVGQQGALITEGLMAVDALQGALRVALCDVSLMLGTGKFTVSVHSGTAFKTPEECFYLCN